MRLGVYKKIFGSPEVININGKLIPVKSGESIIADARIMMGKRGFSFVRFVEDTPETLTVQPFPKMKGDDGQSISIETTQAFQEVDIQEVFISEEEVKTVPVEETKYKNETITEQVGFKQELIDELKTYNHRQWFTMKKNEIKKILSDAGIDFSHIPDEKWELLSFLKTLINIE